MIQRLFPNFDIMSDKKQSYRLFNKSVEYDIFIPSLSLAFEYNGEQHCISIFSYQELTKLDTQVFVFNLAGEQGRRDQQKQKVAKDQGITLIVIPYWWGNSETFLRAKI